MITHTKQAWMVGATVKVGFMTLQVGRMFSEINANINAAAARLVWE